MAEVYGDDWPERTLDLARYLAKHITCRMVHDGYAAPPTVAAFLDGGQILSNVHMVLFKDRDLYRWYRRRVRDGYDARGLWIAPAQGGGEPIPTAPHHVLQQRDHRCCGCHVPLGRGLRRGRPVLGVPASASA